MNDVFSASGGGAISVIGYGSLLSAKAARETAPSLEDFRLVTVPGYKRIFNKVGIFFFEKYKVAPTDLHVSSCATRPDPDYEMICSSFRCDEDDFLNMYEREHRFRWIMVEFINGDGSLGIGRMCTEDTDENYLLNKCVTYSEYYRRVGQYYKGKIWRNDILPFPSYLKHCIAAAQSHGEPVRDNFLDTSFLADGTTTIRDYTSLNPTWETGATDYTHMEEDDAP